jgi:hypothetical protein
MKTLPIRFLEKSDKGSATAEFVIFTLPFFTAFLILITTVSSKTLAISESENLARQTVRAFVTSPNEDLAMARAYQVLEIYKSKRSPSGNQMRQIELNISCSFYPCFSPGNMVTATITVGKNEKASASEYVDLWR